MVLTNQERCMAGLRRMKKLGYQRERRKKKGRRKTRKGKRVAVKGTKRRSLEPGPTEFPSDLCPYP